MKIEIYTDGACKGNPGPGGWGVLMRCDAKEKHLYGAEKHTTNNRMEILAAIKGLQALKCTSRVDLYTDSQYVRNGITQWIHAWKKNNWKNSKREPVKNADLWKILDALEQQHTVQWHWVKGHSGHPENDMADALANKAITELL